MTARRSHEALHYCREPVRPHVDRARGRRNECGADCADAAAATGRRNARHDVGGDVWRRSRQWHFSTRKPIFRRAIGHDGLPDDDAAAGRAAGVFRPASKAGLALLPRPVILATRVDIAVAVGATRVAPAHSTLVPNLAFNLALTKKGGAYSRSLRSTIFQKVFLWTILSSLKV